MNCPPALAFLAIACLGVVRAQIPLTGDENTTDWVLRASALQRYVGSEVPLDLLPIVATHNSYATDEDDTTHLVFEVLTAQRFSIPYQLGCLGVRGIELDPHYVEELDGEGQEAATKLCHVSEDSSAFIFNFCNQSAANWAQCAFFGIEDFGPDDTGCKSAAPTFRSALEDVKAFMDVPGNANEVVFVKLDSFMGDYAEVLSDTIAAVFGRDGVYTPEAFFNRTLESAKDRHDGWNMSVNGSTPLLFPSPAEMVEEGRRVIFVSTEPSSLVFLNEEVRLDVLEFQQLQAGSDTSSTSTLAEVATPTEGVSWTATRVQGHAVQTVIDVLGIVDIPGPEEFLGAEEAVPVQEFGFTPTFDRFDSALLEATIWSWAERRPEPDFAEARAAVLRSSDGRWTDEPSDTPGAAAVTCVGHGGGRGGGGGRRAGANATEGGSSAREWLVVVYDEALTYTDAEEACRFAGVSRDDGDDDSGTSGDDDDGSGSDDDDDGSGSDDDDGEQHGDHDHDHDDDGDDDTGDGTGTGTRRLQNGGGGRGGSRGGGGRGRSGGRGGGRGGGRTGLKYVIGVPRTAAENAQLVDAMTAAGVSEAWVACTSQGDDGTGTACWSCEGRNELCPETDAIGLCGGTTFAPTAAPTWAPWDYGSATAAPTEEGDGVLSEGEFDAQDTGEGSRRATEALGPALAAVCAVAVAWTGGWVN